MKNLLFEFMVGEEVEVTETCKQGTIKQRKYEHIEHVSFKTERTQYYVNFGGYTNYWIDEEKLSRSIDKTDAPKEIDMLISDIMVDQMLDKGRLDIARHWSEQKHEKEKK